MKPRHTHLSYTPLASQKVPPENKKKKCRVEEIKISLSFVPTALSLPFLRVMVHYGSTTNKCPKSRSIFAREALFLYVSRDLSNSAPGALSSAVTVTPRLAEHLLSFLGQAALGLWTSPCHVSGTRVSRLQPNRSPRSIVSHFCIRGGVPKSSLNFPQEWFATGSHVRLERPCQSVPKWSLVCSPP